MRQRTATSTGQSRQCMVMCGNAWQSRQCGGRRQGVALWAAAKSRLQHYPEYPHVSGCIILCSIILHYWIRGYPAALFFAGLFCITLCSIILCSIIQSIRGYPAALFFVALFFAALFFEASSRVSAGIRLHHPHYSINSHEAPIFRHLGRSWIFSINIQHHLVSYFLQHPNRIDLVFGEWHGSCFSHKLATDSVGCLLYIVGAASWDGLK